MVPGPCPRSQPIAPLLLLLLPAHRTAPTTLAARCTLANRPASTSLAVKSVICQQAHRACGTVGQTQPMCERPPALPTQRWLQHAACAHADATRTSTLRTCRRNTHAHAPCAHADATRTHALCACRRKRCSHRGQSQRPRRPCVQVACG